MGVFLEVLRARGPGGVLSARSVVWVLLDSEGPIPGVFGVLRASGLGDVALARSAVRVLHASRPPLCALSGLFIQVLRLFGVVLRQRNVDLPVSVEAQDKALQRIDSQDHAIVLDGRRTHVEGTAHLPPERLKAYVLALILKDTFLVNSIERDPHVRNVLEGQIEFLRVLQVSCQEEVGSRVHADLDFLAVDGHDSLYGRVSEAFVHAPDDQLLLIQVQHAGEYVEKAPAQKVIARVNHKDG